MRDPVVLEVALRLLSCRARADAYRQLLAKGHATTPGGHSIRMVAFGDIPDRDRPGPWTTDPIRHVVLSLRGYLRGRFCVMGKSEILRWECALVVMTP